MKQKDPKQINISFKHLDYLDKYLCDGQYRKAAGVLYNLLHPEKTFKIKKEYIEALYRIIENKDYEKAVEIIKYLRLLLNSKDLRKDVYTLINEEDELNQSLISIYDDQKKEIISIVKKLDELCMKDGAICPKLKLKGIEYE